VHAKVRVNVGKGEELLAASTKMEGDGTPLEGTQGGGSEERTWKTLKKLVGPAGKVL